MRSVWWIGGGLVLGAATAAMVLLYRERPAVPVGMVRTTEIHIAPEVSGRVARIRVAPGQTVHAGDVLVDIANPELVAALVEARAAADEANAARDRVYAGPRQEQVNILAQEVGKARSNVTLAEQQHERVSSLAARQNASLQEEDKAVAELHIAQAELAVAGARLAEAEAGPTGEERRVADATVASAEAAVAVLQRRVDKTTLTAPVDGIIQVIAAEPGEAVVPGRTILAEDALDAPWYSFVLREDTLKALRIGSIVNLVSAEGDSFAARISEIRALGEFATWRAARAVGDHDLNSFAVRADPQGAPATKRLEPGMTVWLGTDQ